uniref:Uncharacterized protein n=1 Tax=Auxenochlorella protothecoides TaxID=3075 RepID=A0A1D2A5F3_AUXPR
MSSSLSSGPSRYGHGQSVGSKWERLAVLTEEQQAAVAALGAACSQRPVPDVVRDFLVLHQAMLHGVRGNCTTQASPIAIPPSLPGVSCAGPGPCLWIPSPSAGLCRCSPERRRGVSPRPRRPPPRPPGPPRRAPGSTPRRPPPPATSCCSTPPTSTPGCQSWRRRAGARPPPASAPTRPSWRGTWRPAPACWSRARRWRRPAPRWARATPACRPRARRWRRGARSWRRSAPSARPWPPPSAPASPASTTWSGWAWRPPRPPPPPTPPACWPAWTTLWPSWPHAHTGPAPRPRRRACASSRRAR